MITIIEEDLEFIPLLESAIQSYGFENIQVLRSENELDKSAIVLSSTSHPCLEKPIRFGMLLEILSNMEKTDHFEAISFGSFNLDILSNTLSHTNGNTQKITEKERDILLTLYECAPASISKDKLLEKIWGYGDNIDTHTLETHIYRLRQKLEQDASDPRYLKTDQDGYKLEI